MPRFSTRTTLTVLIVLGVVFAIFASVQGVLAVRNKVGAHLVGGAMVNLNHDRFTVEELETYKAELEEFYGDYQGGDGHRCESTAPRAHPDY